MTKPNLRIESAEPNPEYLIKSIAEQGYSLETALADLMDNSVSAGANSIEVMIRMDKEPFTLFLADNGLGMDENELRQNMQFPSSSPESNRERIDLGRFGLGMKTASFSQTRKFSVISRKKGTSDYFGRTWDVEYLKKEGWKLIVNTEEEVSVMLASWQRLSEAHLNRFEDFQPNTLIVWHGLFKFESYLECDNRQRALKKEITEVTSEYLALVFHRFMERTSNPLRIRINNSLITPFNPFPAAEKDFRPMEFRQKNFRSDTIKMEGFILPARSIDESQNNLNIWTTKNLGLMDMEGIYLYRADRVILFGGWNGLIRKAPRLQLARLRVEVGNSVDHLLHLNVAKSQIVIPHDLKGAFENYITELKTEAAREFYNRGVRNFSGYGKKDKVQLFQRRSSSKGVLLELNADFTLINNLLSSLNTQQQTQFRLIMRMINTAVNNIRQSHQDVAFNANNVSGPIVSNSDIRLFIEELKASGINSEQIKKEILPGLGFTLSSLPTEILNLLKL
ncbi:ATP-binding protein [Pontibacter beigongshangensis]|uniref:ATP-binding protein n=1 Tax=Pontibacter beigongshangensis TaxID=2574733 RepID=UPI00164EED52|nr:ATP-binding protein [Pontibacter beigongshangensis]